MKKIKTLSLALAGAGLFAATSHSLGALLYNPIVTTVGDGNATTSGVGYSTAISLYANSIALQASPISSATFNSGASGTRLVLSASATSEGILSNSPAISNNAAKGLPTAGSAFAYLAGYDAANGTASVNNNATNANRVVGRMAIGAGSVSSPATPQTQTQASAYNANNIRSATGNDAGTDFWTGGTASTGSLGGWRYFNTNTILASTPNNVRSVEILNNQLFGTTASGSVRGVYAVGSGTPTGTGTASIMIDTGATSSPYEFVLIDDPTNNASTGTTFGFDTAYISDDSTLASGGGIQKWTWNGTAWSKIYTLNDGAAGNRGLAGQLDTGTNQVTLWSTSSDGTKLYQVTDTGTGAAFTTLATVPTNRVFRGVALSPVVAASTISLTTSATNTNLADDTDASENPGSTTAGFVHITGSSSAGFSSEIDGLTANASTGSAKVDNTIDAPIYVMLWLNDTVVGNGSTIGSLLSDLSAAGGATYSIISTGTDQWNPLQSIYPGFNALVKFNGNVPANGAFNWNFANNTDIEVDQIAMVPEPAGLALGALAFPLLKRRRRNV